MRVPAFALSATVVLVLAPACSSTSEPEARTFKCPPSSAKSGSLCQVNFNCPSGDSPAAYCTESTGACDCGPAAKNPKKVTLTGICGKPLAEAAAAVSDACGFAQ